MCQTSHMDFCLLAFFQMKVKITLSSFPIRIFWKIWEMVIKLKVNMEETSNIETSQSMPWTVSPFIQIVFFLCALQFYFILFFLHICGSEYLQTSAYDFLWSSLVFWVKRRYICSQCWLSLCSCPDVFLLPARERLSLIWGEFLFSSRGLHLGWAPRRPACRSLDWLSPHSSSCALPALSWGMFSQKQSSPDPLFLGGFRESIIVW